MKARLGDYIREYSVRNKINEDIPVYSVTNSQGFCKDYFGKEVASKDKSTYKIVPKGCFAYNPSRINVGSVDWQRNEERVIVSPLYNVFSVSSDLDNQYLYYFLKSDIALCLIKNIATGSVRDNLKLSMLYEFPINLPNIERQKEIVSTLDKLQSIITHLRIQLEKLDLLVKARFVEMFGDIYTNKYDLLICPLSDYITFLTSGSRGWAKYCTENGTDWFITIKNVKACKITTHNIQQLNAPDNMEAKRTKVQEDDLLISITADLGRTGVVTKEIAEHGAYINQHLTCVRLNKSKITPIYAAYFMESNSGRPQFEAKNQTGVKAGLNFDSIKSLKISVPPLTLQNQFADFVKQIDKSKSILQQELDKAQMLFDSLMQEYFG
ncbi:MAG TPA: restriction endonuclease subunit S [Ruminococcus sp.]|nr:restriction endonuclease subunit S [Ruminococcus sp.]